MSKIYPSKDVAENKLLILYILEKIKIDVNSIDLTNYILEERLMDFVDFQQHVHELIDDKLITSDNSSGATMYGLTCGGSELIKTMSDMLPHTEKNRVNRTIGKQKRRSINARSVTADYTPDDENNGVVRVTLSEGDLAILEMNIATASKEEARLMCKNWKDHTPEIYAGICELLLWRRQK